MSIELKAIQAIEEALGESLDTLGEKLQNGGVLSANELSELGSVLVSKGIVSTLQEGGALALKAILGDSYKVLGTGVVTDEDGTRTGRLVDGNDLLPSTKVTLGAYMSLNSLQNTYPQDPVPRPGETLEERNNPIRTPRLDKTYNRYVDYLPSEAASYAEYASVSDYDERSPGDNGIDNDALNNPLRNQINKRAKGLAARHGEQIAREGSFERAVSAVLRNNRFTPEAPLVQPSPDSENPDLDVNSAIDELAPTPGNLIVKSRETSIPGSPLVWKTASAKSKMLLPDWMVSRDFRIYLGQNTFNALPGRPGFEVSENSRLKPEVVRELEDELESEYMPFYFHDIRTNEIVSFHAFLGNISDSFTANYESVQGIGRVEPARIYGGTERSISMEFSVIATSEDDFDTMYSKINKLVTLVYPQFSRGQIVQATAVDRDGPEGTSVRFTQPFSQVQTASPLIRIRLGDLFKTNYSKFSLARLFGLGQGRDVLDARGLDLEERAAPGSLAKYEAALANREIDPNTDPGNVEVGYQAGDIVSIRPGATYVSANVEAGNINDTGITFDAESRIAGVTVIERIDLDGSNETERAVLKKLGLLKPTYRKRYYKELDLKIGDRVAGQRIEQTTKAEYQALENDIAKADALDRADDTFVGPRSATDLATVTQKRRERRERLPADRVSSETLISSYENVTLYVVADSVGGPQFIIPHSALSLDENEKRRLFRNITGLGPADLADFDENLADFFSAQNNLVVRSFESTRGRGLAGHITSLTMDWNTPTWNTFSPGRNAPKMCKISLNFAPIHDITPGIDNKGFNRAPVYNVGDQVRSYGSDAYDQDGMVEIADSSTSAGPREIFDNKVRRRDPNVSD